MSYGTNNKSGGYGGRSRKSGLSRLGKVKKGTPEYNMGYRYQDRATGEQFTVHPFGFKGQIFDKKSQFPPQDIQDMLASRDKMVPQIFKGGKYEYDWQAKLWRYAFPSTEQYEDHHLG